MKADFSGYATKAGLKCTDGRTILPNAFQHQDKTRVPLVWQHGHTDPQNVLGHAILENRPDGVYAYGFFNTTDKATDAHKLLEHGDITMLSIWANQLIERSGNVIHGAIREVSLVLSGANPGALIENVSIRHSDGDQILEDEAIIYTGLQLEHAVSEDDETIQEVYDGMTDRQKDVLHFMLGEATATATEDVKHAADDAPVDGETVQDIYDAMSSKQKDVLHFMIGEALESAGEMKQSNTDDNTNTDKEGNNMTKNVFEKTADEMSLSTLSHSELNSILATAVRSGSLKDAMTEYALAHGITNINQMFPDAHAIDGGEPEWLKRRTEWVDQLLMSTRKSPFGRIKTLSADITMEDARAKGYVTGALKKEEFFSVTKRITTPTTVYKKQKLDRDDMLDITEFNVVVWLKSEMRLMLDEEIARAILIGDGRDISSEDKINEGNIRPIAKDHELYTTTINVNVDDALSSATEIIDAIILNRSKYKGTGQPSLFTTETWIARFLLLKDSTGRRIYKSLEELASDIRVAAVIPVEVMEEDPSIVGIIVNPVDYVIGADKGGQVTLFDDFDIDYNQQKYLIETRMCGALTKLKSAMVIRKVAADAVLVSPNSPSFVDATGVLTIVNQTGVVYMNGVTVVNAAGSPYAAIASGASVTINATPASGYYFATSDNDTWTFTRD